ncbi:hypothetical protein [Myxococcus sp. RHSTA-1-4]|uniref:hypothetical protein n=1 Tax=Myxococcus sp. RHSTA-1-4 TaxID=2874601 RepID=UPI001CBE540A|nr:hypothetical protein [Myxococcus sp. RHSTA-1-4]MBZ4418380.1 hypothetical protein [Myxococcus sp. RHSTA-1-4]
MTPTRNEHGHRRGARPRAGLCLAVLLLLGAGCAPAEESPELPPPGLSPRTSATAQALESDNGLSVNGLSFNGLSFNGLSFNGLSFNGLSTSAFASWFDQEPALADMVMRYLIHCAVPAGEMRTYTEPRTGQQYTWTGGLGLAPDWAGGAPATVREQQVVSACLAAHANKYGKHVPISVLGRRADGRAISTTEDELKQYKWRESCFFGNLFSGEGLFVGRDKGRLRSRESSSRACSVMASRGDDEDEEADGLDDSSAVGSAEELELNRRRCAPLVYIGRCALHCVMDESKLFYTSCTYNGVTYQPLTTRLDKRTFYKCGDGICQPTEACGERNDHLSCKDDCGTCG